MAAVPDSATGRPRSRPSSTTSGPTSDDLLDGWVAAWKIAAQRWQRPALPDGLRPAQRAVDGPRVGDLPGHRAASASYRDELQPAMDRAPPRDPRDRPPATSSGGSRSSSRAARSSTTFFEPLAGGAAARPLVAQLLPGRLLRVAGHPGRRRRELLGVQPRPRPARARPGRARCNAAPLMSEWGATDNVRAIEIDAAVADEHLMGWTALGLQALGRPDHRRRRAGPVRATTPTSPRSRRTSCASWCGPTPRPSAGRPDRDVVRRHDRRLPAPLPAGPHDPRRRPGSSSARCTTRTATG